MKGQTVYGADWVPEAGGCVDVVNFDVGVVKRELKTPAHVYVTVACSTDEQIR